MARPWVSEPSPFSAGPSFFKSHVVTETRYYEIHFVEKLRTALIFCRIRENFLRNSVILIPESSTILSKNSILRIG